MRCRPCGPSVRTIVVRSRAAKWLGSEDCPVLVGAGVALFVPRFCRSDVPPAVRYAVVDFIGLNQKKRQPMNLQGEIKGRGTKRDRTLLRGAEPVRGRANTCCILCTMKNSMSHDPMHIENSFFATFYLMPHMRLKRFNNFVEVPHTLYLLLKLTKLASQFRTIYRRLKIWTVGELELFLSWCVSKSVKVSS